ncbi:putative aminodeoxychorismate lyase [Pelotomaculum sp. FP]|uniref:endolytic transglycosylase MltG n=1 Tax=Pelotomaculum sp. FP TaxID=261474 RepID=UPI001065CF08|nr:endolytic transglycosylase MltG [Pelotomaculum sp. FP]TEB17628.1 putative aminodeoxychorismate lyase [Pelotomaculum sp. FP]
MRFSGSKPKNKSKANKVVVLYRYAVLSLAGTFCLAFFFVLVMLSPVSSKDESKEIVVAIPQQATAGMVGEILKKEGLVRSSLAFRLYTRWKSMDSGIKAGQYRLSSALSTPQIIMELVDGRLAVQSITIPEGLNTAQVADLLAAKGLVNREKFISVVANQEFPYSFLSRAPEGDKRLEGYLFPDTYNFNIGDSESAIVETMLKRFQREIDELGFAALAERNGMTLHQAVTIASLVEREAKADEERPLIAGVIYNRLKISMPLQIDATIQYALGENKPEIYYKDLEVDSPYNTYKNYGLPPGPIAMPGRPSLLAAVNPADTDYLYYVAKPDGYHAFATTLAQHNVNKEMYQR